MGSSRRDFLTNSGMVALTAYGAVSMDAIRAQAQSDPNKTPTGSVDDWRQKPTLVCIYLRGGADALHAFVPVGDSAYYQFRPTIAIPAKAGNGNGNAALTDVLADKYWGLNPYMKSLAPLFEQGMVAPIQNVGSPDGTRSHFEAQDYMERGAPGNKRITQGWLNRYLWLTRKKTDAPLRGLSARNLLPRSLRGKYPVLAGNNKCDDMDTFEDLYSMDNMVNKSSREGAGNIKGSSLDDIPTDDAEMKALKKQLTAEWARDVITESGTNAVERMKALEQANKTPISADAKYPGGGLAPQLITIAKCIKANVGLEVAQADYGGWDSHRGQGGVDGNVSRMLGHVSDCIAAFMRDLGDRSNKVLVLVMSEFGREVKENGSNGTDHGRAGMMLAVGGPELVKGQKKQMWGTWNGLAEMNYGRFQPVKTDFRDVFSESLGKMFHFDVSKNADMFPGYGGLKASQLNFLNEVPKA